jgi:hypothetical protein
MMMANDDDYRSGRDLRKKMPARLSRFAVCTSGNVDEYS